MPHSTPLSFLPLTGIYEPSAIQQLPDGRFLIAEDEKEYPFSLVNFHADGSISSVPLDRGALASNDPFSKLDDLEGLSIDASGFVYAITSHSRTGDGHEKRSRDKLVRFQIKDNRAVAPVVITGLKAQLLRQHSVLAQAASVMEVKAAGGLNLEAIEITPDQQRMLLGFRSPLLNNQAIIASIDNYVTLFETGEPARIGPKLETLDLGGHGIRGMAYISKLNGYLIISGPVAKEHVQFKLWFWRGQPGDQARHVTVPGVAGFEHAEGISPAILNGRHLIMLVSDDGDRAAGRYANYLILTPDQLNMNDIETTH